MFRDIIVGGLCLVIGTLIGASLGSDTYINGRLSACKDITKTMNSNMPLQLECVLEAGDVYITSPYFQGKKFTLDGKLKG